MKRMREHARAPLFLMAAVLLSLVTADSQHGTLHALDWVGLAFMAAAFLAAIA